MLKNIIIPLRDSSLNSLHMGEISYEKDSKIEHFKKGSIIPIVSDAMFKTLFSREENIQFPCKLLSYLIDVPYEELLKNIHFTKNETGGKHLEESQYRQDLVVKLKENLINIEMNNNPDPIVRERNLSYLLRLREDQKERNVYHQVIQVNLNNYCYKEDDTIRRDYAITSQDGWLFTETVIIIDIYLPNIKRKCYNKKEELTEMERFLLIGIEENPKKALEYVGEDIVMKEFQENIERSSEEWKLIEAYDKEWAMKDLGKQEGRKDGIKEGTLKEKKRIAKELLKNEVDKKTIMKCTGIKEEELLKLKEEL